MLNSAASTLVSGDTNVMGKEENDSQTMTSQRRTSTKETENLESQFATLKVAEENNLQRPHNSQITTAIPTATTSKDTKQTSRKELAQTNAERNKRSLPSTPRSLYGAPSSPTDINIAQNAKRSSTSNGSSKTMGTDPGYVPSSRYSFDDGSKSELPMAKQTHIAVYKFVARHDDEISFDNGDPVHVNKRCEDLWFEGVNLRTKKSGIFPSRYVSDILQEDLRDDSVNGAAQENQFSLSFLGSIEVFGFKGNEIICDAIKQIVKQHQLSPAPKPPTCTLDVNSRGIKIIEHLQQPSAGRQGSVSSKKSSKRKIGKFFDKDSKAPISQSHFFALKNVTFCGCHPNNARFFAFITKHPEDQRFACHVFMSEFSTEPVANAVGRAFNEFYAEFLDYQAPVEDFYIE